MNECSRVKTGLYSTGGINVSVVNCTEPGNINTF